MVTVNDQDEFWRGRCWICNDAHDHDGVPHAEATGDGITRYDIVAMMGELEFLSPQLSCQPPRRGASPAIGYSSG